MRIGNIDSIGMPDAPSDPHTANLHGGDRGQRPERLRGALKTDQDNQVDGNNLGAAQTLGALTAVAAV